METLKPYLEEHPFLKDLRPDHLDLIVGCASNVRFDARQFVFREGQEANQFYIIRHGKIALELYAPNRGPLTIDTISEGEVLGWSWVVPPYHWHFDARAIELTRAIALDGKCLRDKCEEDYELGYELLKRFTGIIMDRLQATRIQLLDLYGDQNK
ncbi:cyclic nucleotide-binding domain-containing protein [candidate division KSB1 bacterium]|nr:cyclic nucleotide-binding domain-containing protein [candidate division KSB1 bacterium]NIR72788.1 cyclic nucleotide-binding domain-containing protein [candidate division KSB1 bacterium]NIS23744.1 cyclic nucleotide-binding domain-containing protein [candidate division KSB1 bacterium]NIT70665.1 cyclic nucleotide-binding domain-containing protein [candidate division KSB1 bacterium]NIU24392.1 cyclic nucleotide-binding domain-containing protein [candidate division KSB1 bacterium]